MAAGTMRQATIMKRYSTGVTLVELMAVVLIIGILAAIGYPSYPQYAIRGNRTEGKTALLQTSQVMEKCYTRQFNYLNCPGVVNFTTPNGHYAVTLATGSRDAAGVFAAGGATPQAYVLTATPQGAQDSQ